MGVFDFNKKDNKLEEALKKIALIIGEEDKEFFEEYSKGIKDLTQIPFGSLDLFEQVIKMKNDSSSLESHIKESKSFYNKIVFDKNDKTQEKLFIAFELLVLYYKDVLNVILGSKVQFFNDYYDSLKKNADKNTILSVSKKIKIIVDLSVKIKFNLNSNLLLDKLVILLCVV